MEFELFDKFEQLAAAGVVGHTPERPLGRVGDNARGLRIDEFVVVGNARCFEPGFVVSLVDALDAFAHDPVIARDHGVLEAKVGIAFLVERTLEKGVRPVDDVSHVVGGEQPRVTLVDETPVQLFGVAAAANEHQLDHTGRGLHEFDIAKLDVFAGDVAADALADRAVG